MTTASPHAADVLVIGWGLAGLVAATEAAAVAPVSAPRRCLIRPPRLRRTIVEAATTRLPEITTTSH